MFSRANLFVYSNASTSRRSGLSNTGLENVIYCSTTTDAGPIQNFTETSLFSGIPSSMKAFIKYKCIIQLFNPIMFYQTKHRNTSTDKEVWFRTAGGLQGENFSHLLFR